MSRKEALESIERMQGKNHYVNFKELPERKVYFAVAHNNRCSDKEAIKRFLKGERWIGKYDKEVKMVYGYGKLLGVVRNPATRNYKAFSQYIIYDVVIIVGKDQKYSYNCYHEGWIKLGSWVRDNLSYLTNTKEKVIFT